jgi:hypothetical protein
MIIHLLTWTMSKHLARIWRNTPNPEKKGSMSIPLHDDRILPQVTYAGGKTPKEMGDWFTAAMTYLTIRTALLIVSLTSDISRMDAHWCARHHKLIAAVFNHFIHMTREEVWAMDSLLTTIGVTSHGIVAHWQGTLHSGDGHTGVGNSMLMSCMILFVIWRHGVATGQIIPDSPDRWAQFRLMAFCLISLGDDIYILCTEAIRDAFNKSDIGKLGFAAKLIRAPAGGGSFCSANWTPCRDPRTGESVMVLTPFLGKVPAKYFYFRMPLTYKKKLAYVKTVCQGALQNFAHTPINALITRLLELTQGSRTCHALVRDNRSWYRKNNVSHFEANDDTWLFYERKYGVPKSDFLSLMKYFSEITSINTVLSHPVLERIVEEDLGWARGTYGSYIRCTIIPGQVNVVHDDTPPVRTHLVSVHNEFDNPTYVGSEETSGLA